MYEMYSLEAAIFVAFSIIARKNVGNKNCSASTWLQTAVKEFFKNLLSP